MQQLAASKSQQASLESRAVGVSQRMAYLELLPLKDLQAGHGDLEGLSVIILQQMLHATADKVEALGSPWLQRPDVQSTRLKVTKMWTFAGVDPSMVLPNCAKKHYILPMGGAQGSYTSSTECVSQLCLACKRFCKNIAAWCSTV